MSFSFSFPHKPLLHKTIEDQWFDRSPKETQSSLTALESAEEAYTQKLASITTPDQPPVVIGKLQHQRHQQLLAQAELQQQQGGGGGQPPQQATQRSRRSLTRRSAAADAQHAYHTADAATDDLSTVVVNRAASPQATMFWNRPRRSSSMGGGDR